VPGAVSRPPAPGRDIEAIVPTDQRTAFDMKEVITRLVDEGSFFEVKALFAGELITGYARMDGRTIGVVANQSRVKGGVLFHDSAEKGAQFISTCTAYGIPLLFLMDVSGFMVSSQTEQRGIIRRGAKMLMAVAEATQPRICVVVRKAYGAGYMAMSGMSYQPDCMLALPQARLAIMAAEPAVNAMYAKKIAELGSDEERKAFIAEKSAAFEADINVWRAASELFVDAVVPGSELRDEIVRRFEVYCSRERPRLIDRRTHVFRG
jgi:acetyl-CoA carboxylase carboxyltransferase component